MIDEPRRSAKIGPARPDRGFSPQPCDSLDNLILPIFFLTHHLNMLNYLEVEFVMKFT